MNIGKEMEWPRAVMQCTFKISIDIFGEKMTDKCRN